MEEYKTNQEVTKGEEVTGNFFIRSVIIVGIITCIMIIAICSVILINKEHFIEVLKQQRQEETQSTLTPYEQKSISEMNWVHDNCEMTGYSSFGFGDSEQQYEYECNNGEHVSTYKGRIFYRSKQY